MKNIVTVSGGTGGYAILSGLKNLKNIDLTALVTMSDDGGSTGMLRDELGVLPPGDVRQCLIALSEHSNIVRSLMGYRFYEGSLNGHNFGNIFLAALEKVTGDFALGVEIASEILKVKGKVIPITRDKARLQVLQENGKLWDGEDKIDHANLEKSSIKKIFYKGKVRLNEHAKKAIMKADYIILGPGDYFTSIVPNLIVSGFREAILKSKAKIILPINLTIKPGHTNKWSANDHVIFIEKYLGKSVDWILINNKKPSKEQFKSYVNDYKLKEEEIIIKNDLSGKRVVRKNLLSSLLLKPVNGDAIGGTRSFIRHDPKKFANAINYIIRSS